MNVRIREVHSQERLNQSAKTSKPICVVCRSSHGSGSSQAMWSLETKMSQKKGDVEHLLQCSIIKLAHYQNRTDDLIITSDTLYH